jgi:hypothetical protein
MTNGKEGYYYEPSDWADEIPRTIYFYYAKPAGAGKYIVRAYMWVNPDDDPILPGDDLNEQIRELTKNARKNGDNPRPIGRGFSVPWWKKSYFVVALDQANGFEPKQAIEFLHIDGSHQRANHTFFDGGDGTVEIPGERSVAAAWAVNHMKTRHGEDLDEGEVHRFRLSFRPKGRPIVDDGDSGTNMGPPVPPP